MPRHRVIDRRSLVLSFVLLAVQLCRSYPYETDANEREPARILQAGGASLERNVSGFPEIDAHESSRNASPFHYRERRSANLDKSDQWRRKSHQECIVSDQRKGHCRHPNKCGLDEFRSNIGSVVNNMCIIEGKYVGVCCPDNSDTVVASPDAEMLSGSLPAIAEVDANENSSMKAETRSKASSEHSRPTNGRASDGAVDYQNERTPGATTRNPRGPRGCGTSTRSRTRIVGGQPADPREWPWMVALLRQDVVQYCGGVLVTDRHVLTAAHCVYKYRPRDISIRLGEYDFTTSEETRALDFKVTEIRIHRDFDPASYENDIAIVKIHRPTAFNSYIWPICLPPVHQTFENKSGIVTGWGTQYYGGPASTVLMEVSVPIWPQESCVRSFSQRIPRTVMCAGGYEGGRDACQGDSGGPLLHQLGNGRWVNIGIVSWGIRCGEPGHPGIYTRVNSYLDWIFANAVF